MKKVLKRFAIIIAANCLVNLGLAAIVLYQFSSALEMPTEALLPGIPAYIGFTLLGTVLSASTAGAALAALLIRE